MQATLDMVQSFKIDITCDIAKGQCSHECIITLLDGRQKYVYLGKKEINKFLKSIPTEVMVNNSEILGHYKAKKIKPSNDLLALIFKKTKRPLVVIIEE